MNTKSELEALIARLESGDKPMLSLENKEAMKQRLMAKVRITPHVRLCADSSIFSLAGAVRFLAQKVQMTNVQKAEVKERVTEGIEKVSQKRFFLSNYFSLMRKMASASLLLALGFGLFSFMTATTNVVQAGTFTMLESFNGTVFVKRGNDTLRLKAGMPLMENDELITSADGTAVIRYFDNSVSRMDNDTQLQIKRLAKPAYNSVDTHVEISLISGKIWSRVLNLVESEASFVVKANDLSAEAKKAAFTVDFNDGKVEVGVFNHAVSIKSDGKTEQVLTGEKLVANKGFSDIQQLDKAEKDAVWVTTNMKNDQVYLSQVEQRLLDAKRKVVGSTSGTLDMALFMSFDDVNKKKLELDLAERNFMAAQVRLSDKNLTDVEKAEAQAIMQVFGDKIKDFYGLVDEIALTDKIYAQELKNYVDAKVLVQKKDLSVAIPDTPNYDAKKILDEAQLVGANNEEDKVKLRVDQAADKLAMVEDIKAFGNTELATKVVDDYKQDMTKVVEMVDDLPAGKSELKDEVSLKVADNIDLLKAIDLVPQQKVEEVQRIVAPVIANQIESKVDVVIGGTEKIEVVVHEVIIDPAEVVDGPYGVQIQGEKPLPPLLQDIE